MINAASADIIPVVALFEAIYCSRAFASSVFYNYFVLDGGVGIVAFLTVWRSTWCLDSE